MMTEPNMSIRNAPVLLAPWRRWLGWFELSAEPSLWLIEVDHRIVGSVRHAAGESALNWFDGFCVDLQPSPEDMDNTQALSLWLAGTLGVAHSRVRVSTLAA